MGCCCQQGYSRVSRSCSLCGSFERESFRTVTDRILYHRCRICSYVSRDESCRLSPEDERKRYLLHQNRPEDSGYSAWIDRFLDFTFKTPLSGNSRILDFGSGPVPVLASMLKKRGYEVFIEDPYFSPEKPEGSFQLITSLEVFEHIPNPGEILGILASRLTLNGRLSISTEFLPDGMADFETWAYRSDATHIGFFSSQGLARAAGKAGFEEEYCDEKRYISFRLAHRGCPC